MKMVFVLNGSKKRTLESFNEPSRFLNNENMDPIKKSIDNFNECVKRFKGNLPKLNQPRERLGDKYQVKRYL